MSFNSGNNASSGGGGGGGRFGAFLNKAKSTAVSVGQASGAAIKVSRRALLHVVRLLTRSSLQDTSNVALGHGQHAFAGFSLPGESDKAAAILARFLALPVDEAQVVSPGGSVDTDPLQARKGMWSVGCGAYTHLLDRRQARNAGPTDDNATAQHGRWRQQDPIRGRAACQG